MKACFYKTDVTPDIPCHMGGYERKKKSEGVLDPIEVNTMALQVQNTTLLIAMIDSICLDGDFVDSIQITLNQLTKIPKHQIIISCIHTHSAPCFFQLTFEQVPAETKLTHMLKQQVITDLLYCHTHMVECNAKFSSCMIDGIYGNRNQKEAWSDKAFYVLTFQHNEQLIGVFSNISTHPTLLGSHNYLLSADLLGHIRLQLQEHYQCPALISNGACGDVSTRFYRNTQDDVTSSAAKIMKQFLIKQQAIPLTMNSCQIGHCTYRVTVDFSNDPIHLSIRNQVEQSNLPMKDLYLHKCDIKESFHAFTLLLSSTIAIYDELVFITLPGDILSGFGKRIKEALPDKHVILLCYSGNYCNYFVPEAEYGQYFETFNSRLPKGEADKFIQKVINCAKSLIYIAKE